MLEVVDSSPRNTWKFTPKNMRLLSTVCILVVVNWNDSRCIRIVLTFWMDIGSYDRRVFLMHIMCFRCHFFYQMYVSKYILIVDMDSVVSKLKQDVLRNWTPKNTLKTLRIYLSDWLMEALRLPNEMSHWSYWTQAPRDAQGVWMRTVWCEIAGICRTPNSHKARV